ncbi:MAG: hypothetical protein EAZ30_09815 [Betaproteobacteria bacterium]|nr:MAG: hypothetical protein EAZ30_09815 [Betaproteobacteria bacterium]
MIGTVNVETIWGQYIMSMFFKSSATLATCLAAASAPFLASATTQSTYAVEPVAVSAPAVVAFDRLSRTDRQRALDAVRGEYELKNGALLSFGGTANRTTVQLDEHQTIVVRARAPLDYQSIDGTLRVRFTEASNGNVNSVKVSMR